jgi:hypothetical protein
VPLGPALERPASKGWDRYDLDHRRRDHRDFLECFFGRVFTEPHSAKAIEDCVGRRTCATPCA